MTPRDGYTCERVECLRAAARQKDKVSFRNRRKSISGAMESGYYARSDGQPRGYVEDQPWEFEKR